MNKPTGTAMIVFDPESLLALLTHHTDNRVPLGSRLIEAGASAVLQRQIGLLVESDQWEDTPMTSEDVHDQRNAGMLAPLHIRYEGKKIFSWGNKREDPAFKPTDNFEGR